MNYYDWIKGGGTRCDHPDLVGKDPYNLSPEDYKLFQQQAYSKTYLVYSDDRTPFLVNSEGYSYARYVILVDEQELTNVIAEYNDSQEIKSVSETSNKVVSFTQHKQTKNQIDEQPQQDMSLFESLYKDWLTTKIANKQLDQVVAFDIWFNEFAQKILEDQYKSWLTQLMNNSEFDKVVSFGEWKKTKFS